MTGIGMYRASNSMLRMACAIDAASALEFSAQSFTSSGVDTAITSSRRATRRAAKSSVESAQPRIAAIANDIGPEAIFSRQLIAYGAAGDALLTLSTSGNSRNVIEALAEGRRRGLVTIAMVGYDGGAIAGDGLADHVVITRSEHIPRIQEAQASAYHALRELVG